MSKSRPAPERNDGAVNRDQLIEHLNQDLSREYQAIIAYVVYSQVLKGAQYMTIAKELEKHAGQELQHALKISKHIDYLGGMPNATPKPVVLTDKAEKMLRADLDNENDTVREYRVRVRPRDPAAGAGAPDRFSDGARRGCAGRCPLAHAAQALDHRGKRPPARPRREDSCLYWLSRTTR